METNYTNVQEKQKEGSILRGSIGALLAAVVAALLWALLSVATDSVYAVAGLGVGFLVSWGYDLFKGRQGAMGTAIVLIFVVLAIIVGDCGYYGWLINKYYTDEMDVINNGTNTEIAEYVFSDDPSGLAEFNALPAITQNLAVQSWKNQISGTTRADYFQLYLDDPEFRVAVLSDWGQSLLFGLLGSLGLIMSRIKSKKQEALSTEADAEPSAPSDETDPPAV